MKRAAWNWLLAGLLVVGVAWIWAARLPADGKAAGLPPAPAVGHPAPDFTLTALVGSQVRLADLRGRPVVLNFWATWCPPCRAEMPQLEAASRRYSDQVAVIGVNQVEPAGTVQVFANEVGLTYPIPLDSSGTASRLYGVRSLPTTFFIDREGVIRQIQVGGLTEATLADMLRSIYP
jgi:cytochrome c biogenesis protein CcmG, thiol:disulfide interchange protein DsbE